MEFIREQESTDGIYGLPEGKERPHSHLVQQYLFGPIYDRATPDKLGRSIIESGRRMILQQIQRHHASEYSRKVVFQNFWTT